MTRRFLRYLPAILYFCSLLVPAFSIGATRLPGLGALIYGWIGVGKSFGWSWLANPLFMFTMLLFFHRKKPIWRRTALYTAAAAFLLSLSFLLVHEISGKNDESFTGPVTLKAGYWTWVCSMVALLITAILNNSAAPDKL